MAIKIDSMELLETLGVNGERWTQGTWSDGDKMCLHGAIRRCQQVPGDAFLVEQVANQLGWGLDWNDAKSTSWSMVRERIAHVEVSDTDLADTFGPQWEPIVALVRRAAVLTRDETKRLAADRDAACAADRDAAHDAVGVAARHVARYAARDAAGYAARYADRDNTGFATCDAAVALVVRDLIGQHSFTQKHYDTLVGPWMSVIGPVHPDDVYVANV